MPSNLSKFKRFQKNPELESFRRLNAIEKGTKAELSEMEERIVSRISSDPRILASIMQSVGRVMQGERGEQGEKGKDGYTPRLGIDYYTRRDIASLVAHIQDQIRLPEDGKDGMDGESPVAGVDYPTMEQMHEMCRKELEKMFSEKKKLIDTDVALITGKLQERIDFNARASEIARALETLKGKEKLDYNSLKNLPTIPKDSKGKIYARGGGSEVRYYDLTDQCNGVLKTFTIPENKRIVGVFSTQFPVNYRPGTDWTGSGTTTLTLTSEVSAPETSQTLYIIYVP